MIKLDKNVIICGDISFINDFQCHINEIHAIIYVDDLTLNDDDLFEDYILNNYDSYVVPSKYKGNIVFLNRFLINENNADLLIHFVKNTCMLHEKIYNEITLIH